MNFFKRKRKHDDETEKELVEREPKKSRIVSLVQKAGHNLKEKIAVAVKALTSRTYSQDVKSFLFTTPAGPLRSARYIMTPVEPFSAVKSSLEWRWVYLEQWTCSFRGVARIFQRGEGVERVHSVSKLGYSPDCHVVFATCCKLLA